MHIARYFVTFRDGDWKIRYADTLYGPYDRQKTAISQAIDMALIVGQSGGKAEVMVENENGEARLEWPLSHDLSDIEERKFWDSYGTDAAPAGDAAPESEAAEIEAPAEAEPAEEIVADAEDPDAEEHHDADLVESRTPPRGSSIEELAAIMTAALDGGEPEADALDEAPALEPMVVNDEGPLVGDSEGAERH